MEDILMLNRALLRDYSGFWWKVFRYLVKGPPIETVQEWKLGRLRRLLSDRPRDAWQRREK